MIDVIPARPDMADLIRLNREQLRFGAAPTPAALKSYIDAGLALAAVDQGEVLAIVGYREIWPGRAVAWGLLGETIGARMVPIVRGIHRFFRSCPLQRVEAEIAVEHEQAVRWIELLGFEREGVMRAYWQGKDFYLYARVR